MRAKEDSLSEKPFFQAFFSVLHCITFAKRLFPPYIHTSEASLIITLNCHFCSTSFIQHFIAEQIGNVGEHSEVGNQAAHGVCSKVLVDQTTKSLLLY